MKTIAVSKETYKKLIDIKKQFDTPSMDDALERLLENYNVLLKRTSLKKLLEISKTERKVDVKDLLEDRRRYGWPRTLY